MGVAPSPMYTLPAVGVVASAAGGRQVCTHRMGEWVGPAKPILRGSAKSFLGLSNYGDRYPFSTGTGGLF
jgi:hypothetical protein